MKKIIIFLISILFTIFFVNPETLAVGRYGPNWQKPVIKVYIPQDDYAGMMQRAFQKWQSKCNGRLQFEFVSDTPADIEVEFADKTDGSDGDIGSYSLTVKGGAITKAEIVIAPDSLNNSRNLIYTVMLHEIGHALGLKDTKRKIGIMSTPVTEAQDIVNTDILRLYYLNGWHIIDKNTTFVPAN